MSATATTAVAEVHPVSVRGGHLFTREMATRMPFRYGIARVTSLTHCCVQVSVQVGAQTVTGLAADHLAPKWFTKDPTTSYESDVSEMKRVIRQALRFAQEIAGATSPFALWRQLYARQSAWGRTEGLAPLLTHFGVSLVERAVLDAFCRATGRPFAECLHTNAFGIRLGDIHPELGDCEPADFLPDTPLPSLLVRHTVGMVDPLTESDISAEDRLNDGLPQSLADSIHAYGLRHFKLKIGGDPEADATRLGRTVTVIAENVAHSDWAFSVDGNESYKSIADLRAFWEATRQNPALVQHLAERLLFIEQPLHRDIALSAEVGDAFADWSDRPPVIIDESDADLASLPTALSLGYAGTSHKNCKGVFKGIANACLIAHRRAMTPEKTLQLSGEDLSNIGPIALEQDLAVQATLGIESVERNGQHYFAGLSMFPTDLQEAVLATHPDLYRRTAPGFTALNITDGRLNLGTINTAPFGYIAPLEPRTWAKGEGDLDE